MSRSPLSKLQPTGWVRAVAVVGVVALVGLAAIYLAGRGSDESGDSATTTVAPAADDPGPSADRFLAAWARSDWAAIRQQVADDQLRVDETLAAWWQDLNVMSVGFTAGSAQLNGPGVVVPFHAAVEIHGAGTWDYDSELRLVPRGDDWVVDWSPQALHPTLGEGESLELALVWSERGLITDRSGQALVRSIPGITVGLISERIASRDEVADAFEAALSVPSSVIDEVLDRPGVQPDWFLPVSTITREENIDVRPVLYPVPGIAFRVVNQRVPVESRLATSILGTTGEINAEQLAALGAPYAPGMVVGQSGLERSFERQLAGSPVAQILRTSPGGGSELVFTFEADPATDLQTTLSLDAQRAAESALAEMTLPASIVAIDVATGEIRAAANGPGDGFARATSGLYPPGSTFKIIVATALLEGGMQPTDTVSCPSVLNVSGKEFGNATRLPAELSLEDAFARSCNTAFILLAADLDDTAIAETARRFGFGSQLEIGIAAADAAFPTSTDPVEQASSVIGQGEVLASPLNLASLAATAASGVWRPPTLVTRPPNDPQEPLNPGVLANLHTMMGAVVQRGTGRAAAVAGLDVTGKTGTAQIVTAAGPSTVAWFVGFAGDLAFAVSVEGGESGGATAGPVVAAFLTELEASSEAGPLRDCVPAGADWVTFQGDATRSGCSAAEPILEPRKLWQAEVGISGWLNSPIIAKGIVVLGSAGTRRSAGDGGDGVYALDLETGRQRWYFSTANDVNGVATADGIVVATGDEGTVWGLDLTTGTQIWSLNADAPVFTNPLIVEGTVIVGDASGVVWALNLNGTERWKAKLDGAIRGGAASDGRVIYVVSEHGEAAAFTIDGFELWRTRIDYRTAAEEGPSLIAVFAPPTVAGDKLIVSFIVDGGPTTPAVIALDRYVGTVTWRATDPNQVAEGFANVRGSAALFGTNLVMASSLSDGVHAVDADSGQATWMTGPGIRCERQWASPVVVGDLVLLPRADGALHAFDATNGQSMWRMAPAESGEVATLASCTGNGGQIQEGLDLQASIGVAPDGTLIVASTSQLIYAIGGS